MRTTNLILAGLCLLSQSLFQTRAAPNPFPEPGPDPNAWFHLPPSPASCASDTIGVTGIPISSQVVLPPGAQNYVIEVPNQCPGTKVGLTVTVCYAGATVHVVDLKTALVDLGSISLVPTTVTTTVQCQWIPKPYPSQPFIDMSGIPPFGGYGNALGGGMREMQN